MPRKSSRNRERVARIVWFVDGEPELERTGPGPNRAAAEQVVAELRSSEVLKPGDEAIAVAFVMLAEAVDACPSDARLWGQYRDAAASLRSMAKEAAPDDEEDWTKTLGSTEVRDAKKPRPRKPRASGERGKQPARQGPDAVPGARVGRRPRDGA